MPQIKRGENIKCENCGKLFYVTRGRINQVKRNNHKIRFCSHKCYSRKGFNNNQYGNKGKNNHNWKGGKQGNGGYILIEYPSGYRVYEHRIIVESIIGRKLNKNEEIHHINFDRADNRIENLYLFSKAKHKAFHNMKNKPKLKSNLCV